MKVYRGFDKEVGPISYTHWTYVTEIKEQAKWYATKDDSVEDGAIIEYDMDKEHMSWITLSKINSFAENDSEYYEEEDLLWYQEELAYSLYKYVDGIVFQDPYSKEPHTIYIILKEECLKNGRILSKEEFDSIQLNESYYINEVNEVLGLAGVKLNESNSIEEQVNVNDILVDDEGREYIVTEIDNSYGTDKYGQPAYYITVRHLENGKTVGGGLGFPSTAMHYVFHKKS